MKKTIFITTLILLFISSHLWAQEHPDISRKVKQRKIEQKIQNYIQENFATAKPTKYIERYQNQLKNASPEGKKELHSIPYEELLGHFKRQYLRTQFFNTHPNARRAYAATPASICAGGDFESGNFGDMYAGYYGDYTHGESGAVPVVTGQDPFSLDSTPSPLGSGSYIQIVSTGYDPEVGTSTQYPLEMTNGSNYAVRINYPSCKPGGRIVKFTKKIKLQQSGSQIITFDYALVQENPTGHTNQQPFFVARAMGANGQELDRIAEIADHTNPFFHQRMHQDSCNHSDILLWSNWHCGQLEITGNRGDIINLDFFASGCGQTQHFGYAYIDNICTQPCTNHPMGSVELDNGVPCINLPIRVTGTVELPHENGNIGNLVSLKLQLVNSNSPAPITYDQEYAPFSFQPSPSLVDFHISHDPNNSHLLHFYFRVTQNRLNQLNLTEDGYDFQVKATFTFNGSSAYSGGFDINTNPGLNNDLILDNGSPISAYFDWSHGSANGGFIKITGYNQTPGTTNEWYVLKSQNKFGPNYQPVYSEYWNGTPPHTLYTGTQQGTWYTVIHVIKTECGQKCYARVYQADILQGPTGKRGIVSNDLCCLSFQFWPNGPGAPTSFTGSFLIGLSPGGTITTDNVHSYPNNPDVTNEWKLYESPNPSGGPYVLVDTQTGSTYSYPNAEDHRYYFLIHHVVSSCGEVCYLQSISRNPAGKRNLHSIDGVVPCDIFDGSICKAPENINVSRAPNSFAVIQVSWDPVPGADQYIVEVITNDPTCGSNLYGGQGFYYTTTALNTGMIITLPTSYPIDYYSVFVGVKCFDGSTHFSDKECFENEPSSHRKKEASISPNPTDGRVEITFNSEGAKLHSISILDMNGLAKKSISIGDYDSSKFSKSIDVSDLRTGIYFVYFKLDDGQIIIRRLLVK